MRSEIRPASITPGHVVQVTMKFRLLKQEDGPYTFRELLKSVCVLHEGLSLVWNVYAVVRYVDIDTGYFT